MMFLVDKARQNNSLPEKLPLSLVPVNKRAIAASNPMVAGAATMTMPGGRRLSSSTANSTPMPMSMPMQMPMQNATGFLSSMATALPPPAPTITQVPAAAAALGWVVSDAERAQFEPIFRRLDTDLDGFLSGVQCRDLFAQSGLAQPLLAHIWCARLLLRLAHSFPRPHSLSLFLALSHRDASAAFLIRMAFYDINFVIHIAASLISIISARGG